MTSRDDSRHAIARLRALAFLAGIAWLVAMAMAAPAAAQVPDNVTLTPDGTAQAFQEPDLAVDPTNPAHLAVAYMEGSQRVTCFIALSIDGGLTWNHNPVVGVNAPLGFTGEQTSCQAPKVAFGPDGTLHYAYQAGRTPFFNPRQVLVTTSTNGGATFGTPVPVDLSTQRIVQAQIAIAVDQSNGRVYVAWTHIDNFLENPRFIMVAGSGDRGQTFNNPVRVSPPSQPQADEPALLVDALGTLHVGWRHIVLSRGTSGPVIDTRLDLATSSDLGLTFSVPTVTLSTDPGCCTRPVQYAASNRTFDMAAGPVPGQIYAVSWDRGEGGTDLDRRITFSSSPDSGVTWTTERFIGAPSLPGGSDQARPAITVTPSGRVEIVYQEISVSTNGVQSFFEIHSDDGGATFSTPRQLNSAPSDPRIGPASFRSGTASLGAHPDVAVAGDTLLAAWTDTRRGTMVSGKQDIVVSGVPLPRAEPPPSPLPPPRGGITPDRTAPTGQLLLGRSTIRRADLLDANGVGVLTRIGEPGTVRVDVYSDNGAALPRSRARASQRPRRTLVARGTARKRLAGRVRVRVRPTRTGRRVLRRTRRHRVVLVVTLRDVAGNQRRLPRRRAVVRR